MYYVQKRKACGISMILFFLSPFCNIICELEHISLNFGTMAHS